MSGINSKVKGNSFEREVAKKISLWLSDGKDEYIFVRREGSGGNVRDKKGLSGKGGDIFAEKETGEWLGSRVSFELKFYKDLSKDLWNFVAGKSGKLDGFIVQAEESAELQGEGVYWCLVFKQNRMSTLVLTDCDVFCDVIRDYSVVRRNYSAVKGFGKEYFLFELEVILGCDWRFLRDLF